MALDLDYMPAEEPLNGAGGGFGGALAPDEGDAPFDIEALRASVPKPYDGAELETLKGYWSEASVDYAEPRAQSLVDRDYYDGKQWSVDELKKLAKRKQAPTVFNVVQRKVDSIIGVELRTRSEPRAFPRTPQDQKAAEIATDVLRFVKEKERWSGIKTNSFLDSNIEGYAAVQIDGDEKGVPITMIHASEFFFDPRSRRSDFADARYLGTAKWVDVELAKAAYASKSRPPSLEDVQSDPRILIVNEYENNQSQAAEDAINATLDNSLATTEFEDRPFQMFGDKKRRRVFIVDMWYVDREHGWCHCVFTGSGKLFTEKTPYFEIDEGVKKPVQPIVAFSLYCDKENARYGTVRAMRPVQDEINKRRSKALHILSANQIIMEPGASIDGNDNKLRAEANRPDGVMQVRKDHRFEIVQNKDLASGQQQMHENAMAFIDRLGPNPQLMGQQGNAASGRAILALQQSGLGELGVVFERLRDWELRVYRTIWHRVKQFWTGPMYVRVTDDAGAAKFAAVNGAQVYDPDGKPSVMKAPDGSPMQSLQPNPMTGGMSVGPAMETGPALSELDVDIIIDAAPEAATLQAEQFEMLGKMQASGQLQLPPEAWIELSTLPNKSRVIEMLKSGGEKPDPVKEITLEKAMAEIKKIMAQVEQLQADTAQKKATTHKTLVEASLAPNDARIAAIEALAEHETLSQGGGNGAPAGGPPQMGAPPPGPSGQTPPPLGAPPAEAGDASGGPPMGPESADQPAPMDVPLAAGGDPFGDF